MPPLPVTIEIEPDGQPTSSVNPDLMRARLTMILMRIFVGVITATVLYALWVHVLGGSPNANIVNILLTAISSVSALLGFSLGFYFGQSAGK